MAKKVVINLAETITGDVGVTGKVKSSILDAGRKDIRVKKSIFKKATIETIQTNAVVKYDLLADPNKFDRTQAGFWFGLSIDTLMEIRRHCQDADEIFLCAHGSATDRNQVFYDAGMGNIRLLATVAELADFVSMILEGNKRRRFELILIICFAARSGNPDRLHDKSYLESAQSLKTSLAYKLFKKLDEELIQVRMSARLGEVRVSVAQVGDTDKWANQVLTQTEAGVIAGLRMAEIGRDEHQLQGRISEKDRLDLLNKLRDPKTDDETKWLACIVECQSIAKTQKAEEKLGHLGMLVYFKVGTNLVVDFQGEEIYRGAML